MEDAGSADMRQADEEPSTQWLLDNLQRAGVQRDPFREDGQQDFPLNSSARFLGRECINRRSRSRSRTPARSTYRFFSERKAHLANVCAPPPAALASATLEVPNASVAHPPTTLASAAPAPPSLSSQEYIDAVIDEWQAGFDAPVTRTSLASATFEVPSASVAHSPAALTAASLDVPSASVAHPPAAQFSSTSQELDWEIEHWSDPR